eukprot:gene11129-12406_t
MISTDMWVDTDLPLSYTFSFLSSTSGGASNVYLSLKTNSAMNRITAILASANGVAMMGTNVSVIAEDAYNASSGRVMPRAIPVVVGVGNIAMPVHYVRKAVRLVSLLLFPPTAPVDIFLLLLLRKWRIAAL